MSDIDVTKDLYSVNVSIDLKLFAMGDARPSSAPATQASEVAAQALFDLPKLRRCDEVGMMIGAHRLQPTHGVVGASRRLPGWLRPSTAFMPPLRDTIEAGVPYIGSNESLDVGPGVSWNIEAPPSLLRGMVGSRVETSQIVESRCFAAAAGAQSGQHVAMWVWDCTTWHVPRTTGDGTYPSNVNIYLGLCAGQKRQPRTAQLSPPDEDARAWA